jgi:hypothetical protein
MHKGNEEGQGVGGFLQISGRSRRCGGVWQVGVDHEQWRGQGVGWGGQGVEMFSEGEVGRLVGCVVREWVEVGRREG